MSLIHEYNLTETDIKNRLGESESFGAEQLFEVKAVYRNKNGKEWKLCSALIQRVDEEKPEFKQVYKEDAFFIAYKKYSAVSAILYSLFEDGIVVDESYPSIKIDETKHWEEYLIPSVVSPSQVPIRHYLYSLDACNYSDGPLVGYRLPYYSSFNQRLKEFIVHEKGDRNHIHLLVEDSRAMLNLTDERVSLKSKYEVHLSGKLESDNDTQNIDSLTPAKSHIDLHGMTSVELWVIGKNNLIHDYISSSEFPHRYELKAKEIPLEEYLREKIDNGETIDCEFKKFIDIDKGDSKADEIDKTVCAFSNTNGGDLIIGVTDNGEIVGVDEQVRIKYKAPLDESINAYIETLRKRLYENLTSNNCFSVDSVEICGKILIIINVTKLSAWNFIQSTQVPYTRKGSTNYNATRLIALELESNNRKINEMF